MDKKLLLAMQYQCNFAGLAVPWAEIGAIMGEGITGGAVIQHLAKLRLRMVAQNLSVPPPLRRGGAGSRISTSASSASKAKATPTKSGNARNNSKKHHSVKPKKPSKKAAPGEEESEEEDDAWNDDESDEEYGEPLAKRVKTNAKGQMSRTIKKEDSDEEITTPSKAPKRKHSNSKSAPGETTDIYKGGPIDNDSDDDSEVEDESQNGLVAAGAPWLTLEDDFVDHPNTGQKTPYKKKSLIVSLRMTPNDTDAVKDEDTDNDEIEEEVIGGGAENFGDESHVLSNEEVDQQYSNSPYFEGLAAAQLQPASTPNDDNGMYSNLYHAGSQVMPLYSDDQNFVSGFDNTNYTFGSHAGSLPFLNGSNNFQAMPYPIQTSWPSNHSSSVSNETSLNQTPAGTSAGADAGTGYFGNDNFGFFNDANVDYSANDGSEMFNVGSFDGNWVGGGFYGNDF